MKRFLVQSGSWSGRWMVWDDLLRRVHSYWPTRTAAYIEADQLNELDRCRR